MTIIICHDKPQTGNGAGRPLELRGGGGVDIVLGRDGPENLRTLKRLFEVQLLKHTAGFFGSYYSISVWVPTGKELNHHKGCRAWGHKGLKVERNKLVRTACICIIIRTLPKNYFKYWNITHFWQCHDVTPIIYKEKWPDCPILREWDLCRSFFDVHGVHWLCESSRSFKTSSSWS